MKGEIAFALITLSAPGQDVRRLAYHFPSQVLVGQVVNGNAKGAPSDHRWNPALESELHQAVQWLGRGGLLKEDQMRKLADWLQELIPPLREILRLQHSKMGKP